MNLYAENDMRVGYWIRNLPYLPNDSPYPNGGRVYDLYLDSLMHLSPACKENPYFQNKKLPSETPGTYINGRHYYPPMYMQTINHVKPADVTIPSHSMPIACKELFPEPRLHINMASLICTNLAQRRQTWPEIFDLLERCDMHSDCYECTKIGHRIAASLIRVASTRIFADPEQSILELPVNSVDSYFPESRVGKFGMGFFSFLYWLVNHPKRLMHIYSFYEDGGTFCSYHVVLNYTSDGFNMNFAVLDSMVTTTGTFIYLDCSEDPFDEANMKGFKEQIQKLRYMMNGNLYWNVDSAPREDYELRLALVKNEPRQQNGPENVFIHVDPIKIMVEDFAKGIPLHVLLQSLFVPSISTKTIQSQITIPHDWKSRTSYEEVKNDHISSFSIVVNGVAIVYMQENLTEVDYRMILEMSPVTRLPVSRDDIIIDVKNYEEYSSELRSIYLAAATGYGNITFVDYFVDKYIAFTSAQINKQITTAIKRNIYERYADRIVTRDLYNIVKKVFPNAILGNTMNIRLIEKELLETVVHHDNVYRGKEVIFSDSIETPTSAGSIRILFIPEKLTKDPKWVNNVSAANPELRLCPFSTEYGDQRNEEIEALIPEYLKGNLDVRNAVSSFLGLKNRTFIDTPGIIRDFLETLVNFNMEEIIEISRGLYDTFTSLKGGMTYGGGKLTFGLPTHVTPEMMCHSTEEKIRNYDLESLRVSMNTHRDSLADFIPLPSPFHPSTLHQVFVNFDPESLENLSTQDTEQIYKKVVELTDNLPHFIFTILVIFGIMSFFLSEKKERSNVLKREIRSIVEIVRKYSVKTEDLRALYFNIDAKSYKNPYLIISQSYDKIILLNKCYETVREHLKVAIHDIPPIPFPSYDLRNKIDLNLSELSTYLFRNEPSPTIMETFALAAKDTSPQLGLQTLEIAINEGTTKDFVSACLTELVQNSVDAIRVTGDPARNQIEISYSEEEESYFILKVKDKIGIPPNGLISLSIPFLSTKSSSAITTGEMGSGFFNVYRESIQVIIDTVWNKVNYIAIDVPVRKGSRVVDVRRTFIERPTDLPNGTSIYIKTERLPQEQVVSYLGKAAYTCLRLFPIITVFNDIVMTVNDFQIKREREIIATYNDIEIYVGNSFPSTILTNGIPYASLDDFIGKYQTNVRATVQSGIALNIRSGYTPVQSRTRIILSPAYKKIFTEAITLGIFCKLLYDFTEKKYEFRIRENMYYTFYASQASVNQLMIREKSFLENDIKDIFLHTPLPFLREDINIATLTNRLARRMGHRLYENAKDDIQEEFNYYRLNEYPIVFKYIQDAVVDWLSSKNQIIAKTNDDTEEKGGNKKEEQKKEIPKDYRTIEPYIQAFFHLFSSMATELLITNWKPDFNCKDLVLYSRKEDVQGYYSNQRINMNMYFFTEEDISIFVTRMKKLPNAQAFEEVSSRIWNVFFKFEYPAGTFIHEFEHARRMESHMMGVHDAYEDALFPGDEKKKREFDEAANDVYRYFILNGFYERLLEIYRNL